MIKNVSSTCTVTGASRFYRLLLRLWQPTRFIRSYDHLKKCHILTARKRSLRRLCFYTCLSFCPRGAACVVALEGRAWLLQGVCVVAPGRGCMVALGWHGLFPPGGWGGVWLLQGDGGWGHAWLLWGMCVVAPGSVCGFFWGGHAWFFLGGMRRIR